MAITEEEIEEFVDRQWLDRRGSADNILELIGKTNINRNKKIDTTNQKIDNTNLKIDSTNLKLNELINLSGGTPPTKDILPGDIGVSLAIGNEGDIISCVIGGITTNAIAKTNIGKYESIVVVPGGNFDEPYVVSTAIQIKTDLGSIDVSVTTELSRVITKDALAVNSGNLAANGSAKEFDITGFVNTAKIQQVTITQLTAGAANYTFEIWEKDSSGYDPATRANLYLRIYSRDFTVSEDSDIIEPYILYTDRDSTEELHCRIVNNAGGTASDFDVSIKALGTPI